MSGYLPDGVTQTDLDRALDGPYPEDDVETCSCGARIDEPFAAGCLCRDCRRRREAL